MQIFPKKYFIWNEPKLFLPLRNEREQRLARWWHNALSALFILGFVLLGWFISYLDPAKQPPSLPDVLFWGCLLAIVLSYLLPFLTAKVPAHITVWERRIFVQRGLSREIFFDKLASFSWHQEPGFFVLILQLRLGEEILIGVPKNIPMGELNTFLLERVAYHAKNGIADVPEVTAQVKASS